MKVIKIDEFMSLDLFKQNLSACIGYFDGLHLGHQVLFKKTISLAQEQGISSALITFDPDPWVVLSGKSEVKHITPIKDKVRLAESFGFDYYIVVKFTSETAQLSPQAFIEKILVKMNVKHLVCGEDFKFGHRGAGNVETLKDYGNYFFDTHIVEISKDEDLKIGTTAITQAILKGDMDRANAMLGRDYQISGFVVHGAKQGRRIGFPTANMEIVDEYLIPPKGIYAGRTIVNDTEYDSVLNIGYNPTFNTNDHLTVEVHILDFNEEIYGQNIKQSFVKRLRDELKFDSIDALIVQMNQDVLDAKAILRRHYDTV